MLRSTSGAGHVFDTSADCGEDVSPTLREAEVGLSAPESSDQVAHNVAGWDRSGTPKEGFS